MKRLVTTVVAIGLLGAIADAQVTKGKDNWNQFRGSRGDGTVIKATLPAEFGVAKNVRWSTAIHDEGWSSPVVWGDQVWVTAARKDGSELFAICVDLRDGKVIHDLKIFEVAEPQNAFEGYNTHATPTPVIEDGRIYVHFGAYGTACLDTKTGAKLWERRDLKCDHRVRPASSPIIDGNLLFLVFDGVDAQFIAALDKQTGATRWQRERKSGVDFEANLKAAGISDTKGVAKKKPNDNRKAYATPAIIDHQGKRQLVSPAAEVTISYNPETGDELWRVRHEGLGWNSSCRPIYANGLVYVITGFARQLLAIRPDGTGDVTDTNVAWKARKGVPTISSPVVTGELLFMIEDQGGFVSCLDAKTGEEIWKERLGYGNSHWASPLSVGGKVYFFSKEGDVTEIAEAREFRLLANHKFEDGFVAGPAVADNALILRSATHVHQVAEGGNARAGTQVRATDPQSLSAKPTAVVAKSAKSEKERMTESKRNAGGDGKDKMAGKSKGGMGDSFYASFVSIVGSPRRKGNLSSTAILATSEFGRTPKINSQGGRDHWARAMCALMAGGDVQGGRVAGETDKTASEPSSSGFTPDDLPASFFSNIGIRSDTEFRSNVGRPIVLVRDGRPIRELF